MTVYTTDADKHNDKQNYYYNEYRTGEGNVVKYRCHRHRIADGDGSDWIIDEEQVDSWSLDDPNLPELLREHLL